MTSGDRTARIMGNYQIGPRIGSGGMAEVYLATHKALGGFRKLVVMKRLLGWQSHDGEAIENLLDEARIAATINHPNVVTTLDIGLDRGSPYIVLEYLSGEDLLYILQELHARGASIPLGIACRIGASIAAALSQAHNITLPDGSHRCIVHRDVTPSNIIVCYSGVAKLVDFGVARVVEDGPKTKAGTVKGKFSYLAPEQLTGAPLDGRTDVFQLGIVLWEMVTMSRLFAGKSDHERVNAVLNRPIRPPSELNPAVPPGLDRTILRALDRDPARRHQTAEELETELLEALGTLGASGGDHSVGKWMQTAFAERYRWRLDLERRTVAEASVQAEAPEMVGDIAEDDDLEVRIESDVPGSPWSRSRLATGPSMVDERSRPSSGSSLRGVAVEATVAPPRRSLGRFAIPVLVAAAAAIWWWRGARDDSDKRESEAIAAAPAQVRADDYEVDIRVVPAHASIAIDGVEVAKGRYRASFASDGAVHTVTFTAPDHATVHRRFRSATTLEVSLEPLVASTPVATPGANAPVTAGEPDARDSREPTAKSARASHDARSRRRERPAANAAPTAPADAGVNTNDTSKGSAAPRAQPKPADDLFAPSSDNLDPFKTGN